MKLDNFRCIEKNEINLSDYLSFTNYVKANMEHPEWLGIFTKDEFELLNTKEFKRGKRNIYLKKLI